MKSFAIGHREFLSYVPVVQVHYLARVIQIDVRTRLKLICNMKACADQARKENETSVVGMSELRCKETLSEMLDVREGIIGMAIVVR